MKMKFGNWHWIIAVVVSIPVFMLLAAVVCVELSYFFFVKLNWSANATFWATNIIVCLLAIAVCSFVLTSTGKRYSYSKAYRVFIYAVPCFWNNYVSHYYLKSYLDEHETLRQFYHISNLSFYTYTPIVSFIICVILSVSCFRKYKNKNNTPLLG